MSFTARLCMSLHLCDHDTHATSDRQLELEALVAAIRALEALAHERTVAKLQTHAEDTVLIDDQPTQLPYDPASVFLLEIMVSVTSQAPLHIEELW